MLMWDGKIDTVMGRNFFYAFVTYIVTCCGPASADEITAPTKAFDDIYITGYLDVILVIGDTPSVRFLDSKSDNREGFRLSEASYLLRIDNRGDRLGVEVTMPEFSRIQATSGANVSIINQDFDEIIVRAFGGGGGAGTDGGSASIKLSGTCNTIIAEASGRGPHEGFVDAGELACDSATVLLRGDFRNESGIPKAKAKIHAKKQIQYQIRDGGLLQVFGNPEDREAVGEVSGAVQFIDD